MSRDTFNQIFDGELTHKQAGERGVAKITGNQGVIGEFIAMLDRPEELPTPHIALR